MQQHRQPEPRKRREKAAYDASNPDHIRAATVEAKAFSVKENAGLTKIVKDPEMRAWLHSILKSAHVFGPTFTGNSSTFYNDGRRELGIQIMEQIAKIGIEYYILIIREHYEPNSELVSEQPAEEN